MQHPMRNADTLSITGRGDNEIIMSRRFSAPRRLVYDAYTQAELLKRWFGGPDGWKLVVCTSDLRVGGAYRFGMEGPNGAAMGIGGIWTALEPHDRFANTERFDPPYGETQQLITTTLDEADGQTTLTAVVLYETREARDGMLGSMTPGVAASYDRLEGLLADLLAEGV